MTHNLCIRDQFKPVTWLMTTFLLTLNSNVLAVSDTATVPIDIAADSVEIDESHNTSTYTGTVEASQGSMHLWADHVVVQHQPSRQPERIVATGAPVRYQQQEQNGQTVQAESARIEYDVIKGEIILIGDAKLTRSHDTFSSDRIFYDRKQGVIKAGTSAQGRQRVRISIVPSTSKNSAPTMQLKPQEEEVTPPAPVATEEQQSSPKPSPKTRSNKTTRSRNYR